MSNTHLRIIAPKEYLYTNSRGSLEGCFQKVILWYFWTVAFQGFKKSSQDQRYKLAEPPKMIGSERYELDTDSISYRDRR